MILRFLILFVICSSAIETSGQQMTQTRAEKYYQKGHRFLLEGRSDKAITWFSKCLKEDSNYVDAILQLGEIAFKKKDWDEAQSLFIRATSIDPQRSPIAWYRLGVFGWEKMDYLLVQKACKMYLDLNPTDQQMCLKTRKYLRDAIFSLSAKVVSSEKPLIRLNENINTPSDEYFPSLTADGQKLVFTRRLNGQEDLVMSELLNGKWSVAKSLANINTINNEGAHSISFDGKSLFFTACNRADAIGRCDIYASFLDGDDWSKPVNVGAPVNSPFWESQPVLAPDGKTLYFSSDRPGGHGGKDIYYAQWSSGSWSDPINLGPEINTPYDEEAPFIHADGTSFYFISDGHPGLGASDIFYSKRDPDGWAKPENVGYPINSREKESRLHVSISGNIGFLAREEQDGHSDIYQVELPVSVQATPSTYAKINVLTASDEKRTLADIEIYELKSETKVLSKKNIHEEIFICLPAGQDYGLHVFKEGYIFYSQSFILSDTNSFLKPYEVVVSMTPISIDEPVSALKVPLQNVFFAFGSSELLPESKTELDLLLDFITENPGLKVKIIGHTDNIGSPESNLVLSKNRANAVVKYLVKRGVSESRLVSEGLGDSQPIATNETEQGRRQNRRTELEIMEIR